MNPTPLGPMPRHYEAAVDRDLNALRAQLRHMADLVLAALASAREALHGLDRRRAWQVILEDNRIDALEERIDRLCQEFLVRHMPAGRPLRFVVAAIKVNAELERIGDYADAIAHRVVALHGAAGAPLIGDLGPMFERAITVAGVAVEAFLAGDAAKAQQAVELEGEVDDLNRTFFDQLSHSASEAAAAGAPLSDADLSHRFAVLGILNRLERVADRALNIAEHAIWAEQGTVWRHHPRTEQKVLFLSPADATLGPMAEAIARSLAPLQFTFASAGLNPAPLNPLMAAFMQGKGFDILRPRPRGIGDVGPLEDYSVIVALSQEVEDNCPPLPYRTVQLAWDIPDPARSADLTAPASLQRAFDELSRKIPDLIDALIGADTDSGAKP